MADTEGRMGYQRAPRLARDERHKVVGWIALQRVPYVKRDRNGGGAGR
jgi:hypothetical protein